MNRHYLLKLLFIAVFAFFLITSLGCDKQEPLNFAPYKVGISTYVFRNFPLPTAINKIKKLGVNNIEISTSHVEHTISDERKEELLALFEDKAINVVSYGVVDFTNDTEENRRIIKFVRDLGINLIIANPVKESVESLYELAGEYGVGIAIQNGGPDSRWDTWEDIYEAWPYSVDYVGTCVNTGQYMRSRQRPSTAIKNLQYRVFSVHLTDFSSDTQESTIGGGELNVSSVLMALKEIGFPHYIIIDISIDPDDPMPALKSSIGVLEALLQSS